VEGGGEEPRGERDGDGRRQCEVEEREGERVAAPVRSGGLGLGRLYRWKGVGWARLVFWAGCAWADWNMGYWWASGELCREASSLALGKE
jgi:hypothetical protein